MLHDSWQRPFRCSFGSTHFATWLGLHTVLYSVHSAQLHPCCFDAKVSWPHVVYGTSVLR